MLNIWLESRGLYMRALGIDPGSHRTGYGVVERKNGRYLFIACGVINPPSEDPLPARLAYIHGKLTELLAEVKVAEIAVESIFYYKNAQSAFVLGQARGVALCAAAQAGARVFEYPPSRVKLAATGSGRASKEQVQQMIKALLALPAAPPPDAADALAVAICHLDAFRLEVPKASLVLPGLARRR